MTRRNSGFLYKGDFDAIMVVIDAEMLQNDEELHLGKNPCIKICHRRKNQALNVNFVINFGYQAIA